MPIITPKEVETATTPHSPRSITAETSQALAPIEEVVPAQIDVAPPKAEPKDELLSPRFAALARQQKDLRRQQAELRAREEEMKTRLARYEQDYIPKSKLTEDPLGVLGSNGISYDKLVELAVQYPTLNDPVIKQIREEITSIKEEKSQAQKLNEEAQKKNYETALNQIRIEAKLLIDSDSSFETVKESDASEAVVALIEETFKEEGRLLSVQEAAQLVEDHLVEDFVRMASFKKVKARLQPTTVSAVAPQSDDPVPKKTPSQQPIKTITNAAMTAPSRPLSQKDRIARAIAVFNGEQI